VAVVEANLLEALQVQVAVVKVALVQLVQVLVLLILAVAEVEDTLQVEHQVVQVE
jgi:hypothetical protein